MDTFWMSEVLDHLCPIEPECSRKYKQSCNHDSQENAKLNIKNEENAVHAGVKEVKHLQIFSNFEWDDKYKNGFTLSLVKDIVCINPIILMTMGLQDSYYHVENDIHWIQLELWVKNKLSHFF